MIKWLLVNAPLQSCSRQLSGCLSFAYVASVYVFPVYIYRTELDIVLVNMWD